MTFYSCGKQYGLCVFSLELISLCLMCVCIDFWKQGNNKHVFMLLLAGFQGTSLKGRRTASKESVNVGEAVFVPCISPPRAPSRPSTAATSSNFQISSSSYEDSSQSVTGKKQCLFPVSPLHELPAGLARPPPAPTSRSHPPVTRTAHKV